MLSNLREYILLLLILLYVYSFLKIYMQSKSYIKESEKIKRESSLFYSPEKKKEINIEQEGITITGSPDEVYETKNGDIIIINYIDSLINETEDYFSYLMGVYFILIEKEYNRRPVYGIFEHKKSNKIIKIDNTTELKKDMLKTIKKIKDVIEKNKYNETKRDHEILSHCIKCPYNIDCQEKLT